MGTIPTGTPLIHVANLTKDYRSTRALNDISLSLPAGHIVGLMGENGSGKTTLLKILAGLLSDWEGDVTIAGNRPGPETKATVSFLPDTSFLPSRLTCADAIALYARFFADFDAAKAYELVTYFGLPQQGRLKEMSRGMREKLQVALTMARRARVYLLDEPISGVDPAARETILGGILNDFNPEALMIISTHLIADVETIVDSVVFLRAGRILLTGDADDLRAQNNLSLDGLFRKEYR
ncbi:MULTISPECIES: ABC transporter ATP-binding protein [unclassified Actinobaculum]|uniref:ABC transporter ATP-binding protein n=1 Tax=unclassified Actinobaculum TaxID=2609299 RepID=UPI000D526295|nr:MULTISPECIES: ABC transporter ATP-binding protein [unclassified Actinobaculum]AWE41840.1 ABC transporter ATP-binding protein [Actinobaculum sp. 313]RTE50242.1 ABC transporter ATP-binding protein [Actinobaculum sp. 352]